MPTGYSGLGLSYSKIQGRWLKKQKENAFSIDRIDKKAWALLISFWRHYPDYWYDLIRSKDAPYKLELPQRIMLRVFARFQTVYITGARGIVKTMTCLLAATHRGTFWTRDIARYYAPAQKQSAALASQAFAVCEQCYPIAMRWWLKKNDRSDMFKIVNAQGSEFSIYSVRGDNLSTCIAEEMASEGEDGFPFDKFEADIKKGHRLERLVRGVKDRTTPQLKFHCISNAASRTNPAYTIYRKAALNAMINGKMYDGFCMDISWKSALLCNIRSIAYYKKERGTSSYSVWQREMEVKYTGLSEDSLVSDETLSMSRSLMCMEDHHTGNEKAIYIVAVDYSFVDNAKNAKCGLVVLKLTPFTNKDRPDKYRKQVVWVDSYPPPRTTYAHAQKVKEIWARYCKDGAQATYLVMDERNGGALIVPEFMKPTQDGMPSLCCYNHLKYADIEQKGALPIIYPIAAGSRGAQDEDGAMIRYAQVEFEQGNIELLTSDLPNGIEQYKRHNDIKDDYFYDSRIAYPYKKTDQLCQQIQNLTTTSSGFTTKEVRRSKTIQRDIWSALKYALRMANVLEEQLVKANYRSKSSWANVAEQFRTGQTYTPIAQRQAPNTVQRLLQARRVRK